MQIIIDKSHKSKPNPPIPTSIHRLFVGMRGDNMRFVICGGGRVYAIDIDRINPPLVS